MTGLLVFESLGLALAAAGGPVATTHTVAVSEPRQAAPMSQRARTRDERIGSVALRGFPSGDRWEPPAKSWGDQASGPVLEIGTLGGKRVRGPDLAHVSLDWQF
ncbi:hypothetical protein B0I00_0354 [Novosphingobium kunmingense]|uniref:Uncharacterized protein n=1 Tax=Novosphingobium kunmingense TaxID=1211806 RepID=A0A2N0I1W6_9SPHN|nr:hypothetical protein [Novosphingobium kunmingense]PKB25164.1 hypothetical protein B0I00_0354 [Novosphingobium kunmingense]